MKTKKLLTVKDVQSLFSENGIDLCSETIRRYARSGQLKSTRTPKFLMFARADVLALLQEWGA